MQLIDISQNSGFKEDHGKVRVLGNCYDTVYSKEKTKKGMNF